MILNQEWVAFQKLLRLVEKNLSFESHIQYNRIGEKSKYCFCNTNKKKQDKVFSAGEDKRLDKQTEGDFIRMEKKYEIFCLKEAICFKRLRNTVSQES